MKFKAQATVTYVWEENSDNWEGIEPTQEAILAAINAYVKKDASYIFDCDPHAISDVIAKD